MEEIDVLLSDKFVEFSQKIQQIYVEKKKKKENFKKLYENYQVELKELDEQAKKAQGEFNTWKESLNDAEK